jgi:hypothetical protein
MSHDIPKISYGDVSSTDIVFDYPPAKGGDGPEEYDVIDHTNYSVSGVRQTSVDRIEAVRKLTFSHVSETILSQMQTFFLSWGYLGKSFKYYEDQSDVAYTIYQIKELKFQPKRILPVGANSFVYEFSLVLRRVIGAEGNDDMTISIANNQASPANLTGLTLDYTTYQSVKIYFEIKRTTSTSQRISNGYLTATYNSISGVWSITPGGTFDGDDPGVAFDVSGQQITYTSDNQSGANYVGQIKLKEFIL